MDELYEKLYRYEIKFSETLFEKIHIHETRIEPNDYIHIKDIFKNRDLMERIYRIISTFENLKEEDVFLILSDFLFSITSYSPQDPANLIYKITRNDYLNKIRIRASINVMLGQDFSEYIEIHKKLLVALREDKIIKKSIIKKMVEDWSTLLYFKLDVDKEINHQIHIGYSEKKFLVVQINGVYYVIGSFRNVWLLKRKRKEMKEVWIDYKAVKKSNKMGLILSKELYKMNEEHLNRKKSEILKKIGCENIDEYFKLLKKIVENERYSNKIFEKETMYKDIIEIKKEILSEFQNITTFMVLQKNIFNRLIYLPCFIDNRGRQYFATLVSPTFYKIFRYLYEFYEKKKFKNLENSRYYREIMKYRGYIKEFSLNEEGTYIAIVLFLEVGKFFIKNSKEYIIKTEKIIEYGIDNYKNKTEIDFTDMLYLQKIYNNLDKIINNLEVDINTILFKDATSSGLQNYGILLGYQEEKLKFINLDGNDWCDTYMYIIDKFLKTDNIELKKRKYWKSTIMTIPYNSVWYSCYAKFLEKIKKDNLHEKFDKEELKLIHKNFYNSVKNEIKKEFYKSENGPLKMFLYYKWKPIQKNEYKINYKRARDKYVNVTYMVDVDDKATENALEANNMHYLDAQLVGFVLMEFDVLTVHDCFGIRLCELHLVMDRINKYYSKVLGKNTYSIHVII